jgi:hypothetical protein
MNLIELLKNEVSDKVISSLSQKAGVSEDQVKTGFSAGISWHPKKWCGRKFRLSWQHNVWYYRFKSR